MSQLIPKSIADKKAFAKMAAVIHQITGRAIAGAANVKPSSNPKTNPHGWKSWRDIPDSMIPITSKRDPDNPIYATRAYVNFRKQQIWYQIPDGVPVFLKGGATDKLLYYGIWVSMTAVMIINFYYIGLMIFNPDKLKK